MERAGGKAMSNCGVYLLLNDEDEVVYVGRSKRIDLRINAHRKSGKDFTHYSVIDCEGFDQRVIEREQIHKHSPKYNKCKHISEPKTEAKINITVPCSLSERLKSIASRKGMLLYAFLNKELEKVATREEKKNEQQS
jgi:predicted GIY-YIG superfamily endonuclease